MLSLCNRPTGNALKLGGKKDVESFVDQLKSEGESKAFGGSAAFYMFFIFLPT